MHHRAWNAAASAGSDSRLPCSPSTEAAIPFGSASLGHPPEMLDGELWEGPTLAELADRVEHQFGRTPALAGIFTLGFGRDEPLTPCDVHLVCDLLGLPAEDFGIDA